LNYGSKKAEGLEGTGAAGIQARRGSGGRILWILDPREEWGTGCRKRRKRSKKSQTGRVTKTGCDKREI